MTNESGKQLIAKGLAEQNVSIPKLNKKFGENEKDNWMLMST